MLRINYCEIDLAAIRHNIRVMKGYLREGTKFLAVVKANAYGHGAVPVARAALAEGADFLAVAIPEEGIELREAGLTAPILVLGGILTAEAAQADCRYDLTQVVFDEERIQLMSDAGTATGRTAKVHLGMDTGMSRIGVRTEEEVRSLVCRIDALPGIELTGCFTHMATADEAQTEGTEQQIRRFEQLVQALRDVHAGPIIVHGANTASIFRYPQLHHDMVRGGIALYGCPPVPEVTELAPTMRWVTSAVYVKTIHKGDQVSYGGVFEAQADTRVMTVPVGYADGYRRGITGKGCVLVHGRRAPIIGRICMDQMMVDVTEIPDVKVGDEVVLLGRQGEEILTPDEMAGWIGTISYEVLCSPSQRVPRTYIHE